MVSLRTCSRTKLEDMLHLPTTNKIEMGKGFASDENQEVANPTTTTQHRIMECFNIWSTIETFLFKVNGQDQE
jgi:hypothetical protein